MNLELAGKTAYVTGGAKGIGSAIVDALLTEGAVVAISDVDDAALQSKKNECEGAGRSLLTVRSDLSTSAGCGDAAQFVLDQLGVPDILINNVGVAINRPFEDITDEGWMQTFNINFMSHVRTCRHLIPLMAKGNGGSVVNIASDLAKQPEAVPSDYGACKAALLSLTKSLAIAYAPAVRINAVCPGPIWTELWSKPGGVVDLLSDMYGLPKEAALERYLSERRLPLGIGEPADVAALVAFLVSPRAKYITASSYEVGGSIRSLL